MLTLLLAATTLVAQAHDDDDDVALDLRAGTYQIGGSATANVALGPLVDPEGSGTDIYLLLRPTGGYFVTDNTLLYLGIDVLLDDAEGSQVGFGAFAGVDYFLGGEWARPYVGVGIGYGTRQLDDSPQIYATDDVITASLSAGLALPVSDHIALDFGAEFNYNFVFENGDSWMTIPMGYTGVRAFFR